MAVNTSAGFCCKQRSKCTPRSTPLVSESFPLSCVILLVLGFGLIPSKKAKRKGNHYYPCALIKLSQKNPVTITTGGGGEG